MAEKQTQSQLAEIEEAMLQLWDKEHTFQKSLEQRKGAKNFSFYDGPPFANGLPHFGHSLVTSIKDSLGRYKTMRGYYVERHNGWDCHGLPVEFAIEKQFGVSGKKQILELGLEKFNAACRDSVFTYKKDWEDFFKRIGRWTDTDNAYATIDRDYTESVWWVLGEIHKKGLLYKGYKSMPYCPRCETPLSNFEVNEGYRDDTEDPSLFVKFKLTDEDASLLAWTTTPWSLPGNAAIALNPEENYVYVRFTDDNDKEDTVILAKSRLEVLDEQDYIVVKEVNGKQLVGKSYEPLFELADIGEYPGHENLYKIWTAGFVSIEDGTGVLHVAPAFGEDDLKLGEEHNLPVLQTVDSSGHIKSGIGYDKINNKFFKSADRDIIEFLTTKGAVFAAETIKHTYPFCYRCDTPLLYYAINTWFVKVSSMKSELLETAQNINWTPGHIKEGRFGKWLAGARDWAISRNRYWGAPMPIWVNEADETDYIVVSSLDELKKLAGPDAKLDDLHRPFIDDITFEKGGKKYKRIEEVLDCWFESGSMPVAQNHYPFENKEKFDVSFPADYIGEGLDQTRLWFYVLHVISTALFDKPAYKNVLVNGMINAADGQKLSKRLKNYPAVDEVFAQEGADTLRLYLLSSNQAVSADYMRFNRDAMKDLNRNVLGTLMNTARFFTMYADIDGWKPPKKLEEPKSTNILDEWLLARLNQTITVMTEQADAYKLAHAIQPVFSLIDDLSNWYVRRSRRRFWKSEDDGDKKEAYATLHYALVTIMQLLAPWAPFVSDKLYRDLTKDMDMPASVHLTDWPEAGPVKPKLIEEMALVREYINEGLSQRAAAGVKVRQPLQQVSLSKVSEHFKSIISEELNVKEVIWGKPNSKVVMDTTLTDELKVEGLMRELVRNVQNARKNAGLNVEDRIDLSVESDNEQINKAIQQHNDTIKMETLALSLNSGTAAGTHTESVKLDGEPVTITLKKAHS
jgi:isoleucyl-tRNA synthetase